jgi:predicted small lipoprotein YifL
LFSMLKPNRSSMLKTLLLALLLATALWGCGKKGPPLPPESNIPAAVSDLRAWPREGTVFFGWSIPTRNVDGSKLQDLLGFKVFRLDRSLISQDCPECPRNFKMVAEVDIDYPRTARIEGGKVLWTDPTVKPQTEYTYFVMGYNSYKSPSPESNRVKVFWNEAPPAPEEVMVRSENQALEITWRSAPPKGQEPSATGFNLYRRSEGERFGFLPLNPEPLKETRFVDGGLQNGRKYSYEVRAVRNFQGTLIESPASAVVEGIPDKKIPPSPPRGLLAVYQEGGVALRWDENPEPDVAGYDVYRRAEDEETFRKMTPGLIREPHFLDPSADPRKSYTYRLKAVDSSPTPKESDFSQDADVSPLPVKP